MFLYSSSSFPLLSFSSSSFPLFPKTNSVPTSIAQAFRHANPQQRFIAHCHISASSTEHLTILVSRTSDQPRARATSFSRRHCQLQRQSARSAASPTSNRNHAPHVFYAPVAGAHRLADPGASPSLRAIAAPVLLLLIDFLLPLLTRSSVYRTLRLRPRLPSPTVCSAEEVSVSRTFPNIAGGLPSIWRHLPFVGDSAGLARAIKPERVWQHPFFLLWACSPATLVSLLFYFFGGGGGMFSLRLDFWSFY